MSNNNKHGLHDIRLFTGLPEASLDAIESRCRTRSFRAGELVLHHNEDSTDLFFVLDGRVRVVVYSAMGKSVAFRDIREGDVFGELAALDHGPRSANVIALSDTRLAVIPAPEFRKLLGGHPEAVSREIARLSRDSVVAREHGDLVIHDLGRLNEMVEALVV